MNTSTAQAPVVLQAQSIQLGYPNGNGDTHTVLRDFSLQLAQGETVAILGPSGVGKSSLLRVLAGLQSAQGGTVTTQGQVLRGPHPRLGFVFQDASLLPWLKLEENVAFGLDFRHQPALSKAQRKARVAQAIADVELTAAKNRYPSELSGGMAQRTALARALARQPDILLLDEPFSALDEVTRAGMQQLLLSITSKYGSAALLVTHDIDEALKVADRVVLINGTPGTLVAQWQLDAAQPRNMSSPSISAIREQILHLLRHPESPVRPASATTTSAVNTPAFSFAALQAHPPQTEHARLMPSAFSCSRLPQPEEVSIL